jgi:hypothetical protein
MKFFIVIIFCMTFFAADVYSADAPDSGKTAQKSIQIFSLNNSFLSELATRDPMKRDQFLFSKLNTMIEGTLTVARVEEKSMFKRKYRITGNFGFSSGSLICHIYSENQDYLLLLSEGQKISFKGQLVMVTPLGSKRDSYILDIILEDGAAVVE